MFEVIIRKSKVYINALVPIHHHKSSTKGHRMLKLKRAFRMKAISVSCEATHSSSI